MAGQILIEMAGNGLKWLEWPEMARYSWKWLERSRSGWKWVAIAGMAGNGWK